MTNIEKLFCVFNQKLAEQMILAGHQLQLIKPNRKFPNFNVFYFDGTDEFKAAFYAAQVKHKHKGLQNR